VSGVPNNFSSVLRESNWWPCKQVWSKWGGGLKLPPQKNFPFVASPLVAGVRLQGAVMRVMLYAPICLEWRSSIMRCGSPRVSGRERQRERERALREMAVQSASSPLHANAVVGVYNLDRRAVIQSVQKS